MNKPKHPQGTKWKDPHPRKQKNHLTGHTHHKGNIKFLNLLLLQGAYQIRKGGGPPEPERRPSLKNPHLLQ
jgi:hypothetical protein